MNYDFKTKQEFRDFIIDALQSGRYNQKIQNLTKGINSISNSNNKWEWIEDRKLYVVTNNADTLYIIFPILRPSRAYFTHPILWCIPLYKKGEDWRDESLGLNNQFEYSAGSVHLWELRGGYWVKEYILLDSHSAGFINWKKNPFENK